MWTAVPIFMVSHLEASSSETTSSPVVQSLIRGLSVIRCFDAQHSSMTLSAVARRTGLPRATARRILHTLSAIGYVMMDDNQFSLRPRILELGYTYLSSLGLPEIATPHLEKLTAQVNESSSVALLDDMEIVYVARVSTRKIMRAAITIGTRFPAHLTSMGRILLAALDAPTLSGVIDQLDMSAETPYTMTGKTELKDELARVARQGWALVDQELEVGLRSIAVPLHNKAGSVVAAVNVSTSSQSVTPDDSRAMFLPALKHAARDIEQDFAVSH